MDGSGKGKVLVWLRCMFSKYPIGTLRFCGGRELLVMHCNVKDLSIFMCISSHS